LNKDAVIIAARLPAAVCIPVKLHMTAGSIFLEKAQTGAECKDNGRQKMILPALSYN
jgi:hypothetical protein